MGWSKQRLVLSEIEGMNTTLVQVQLDEQAAREIQSYLMHPVIFWLHPHLRIKNINSTHKELAPQSIFHLGLLQRVYHCKVIQDT
jgi:hypothetical protein